MILDQRRLPGEEAYLACRDLGRVIHAIKTLATRGAPAIGGAAAMGLYLAARAIRTGDPARFRAALQEKGRRLKSARPTAVNLAWAVDRVLALVAASPRPVAELRALIKAESQRMLDEDLASNRALGRHGAGLVTAPAVRVLTHCNAGALATAGYGTALGVVYALKEAGKAVSLVADETRPLGQGLRLTAWEAARAGIPVKVAVDGASGLLMARGLVDLCVVGADRIAANGDTANKIGTLNLALAAKRFGVPFYVAAPLSTVDLAAADGAAIPIEERDPAEVLMPYGKRGLAAAGVQAYNFAFDVTPHDLILGIITEVGVLRPPYAQSLNEAKAGGGRAAN